MTSGKRVLLIDNDVQGNLTAALGYTPAELKNTLAKLLLAAIDTPEDLELHLPRTVIHTESSMNLIPANKRLADAAARLQVMQLSQYNAVGDVDMPCEKMMDRVAEHLRDSYDYIIIDCGLKHELLTVNALAASDYCIIPVQAHFLASEGIPDVLKLVQSVRARFNPRLKIAGILLSDQQGHGAVYRQKLPATDGGTAGNLCSMARSKSGSGSAAARPAEEDQLQS